MKYSYNWLKKLSGTKLTPEKAAELLTMRSMEVEGIEKTGSIPESVVVGKILEIKKHPNADKLQITKIDVGTDNYLSIVCGANNISVGDKIPVAMIGTKLPNGLEIKEAEIRGEKSQGMLCAQDELGLGKDHSGIYILNSPPHQCSLTGELRNKKNTPHWCGGKDAKVGMSLNEYLKLSDTVFEIKVLPDRAHDAMSHVGVAREISVLEGRKFGYDFEGLKLPRVGAIHELPLRVEIKAKDLCYRYIGAVMENVEVKESPEWMKARLKASGMNSINNIVDATNYVMLELGQPLHAFDAEKIKLKNTKHETQIVIRRAEKKEKLVLLDESEIELSENDLLITNGETPLALAGIMGGKDSGISNEVKTIIIESASFNAVNTRRTRTRLGLKTEASDRYEKEIDPNLCEKAMARVVEILEHTANAKLVEIVDEYPKKVKTWKIKLDLNYVNNLLGETVTVKEVVKILNLLGILTKHETRNKKQKFIDCMVPAFRLDLKTQEDIIEEIGRIWGYEKIKSQSMTEEVIPAQKNEQVFFERKVRDALTWLGFDEMYNYSFYSRRDAEKCALNGIKHYELANPMNPDQELVRMSLVPNILKNVKMNLKNFENFSLFEIGRTYFPNNGKTEEKRMLLMAQVLDKDKNTETFYRLKGAAEDLLESLGVNGGSTSIMEVEPPKIANPGRAAEITVNEETIGMIAEINPQVLAQYKITKRAVICEIDLEKLLKLLPKEKKYQPIGKFPTVSRDISMIVPKDVTYAEISGFIRKAGGSLVNSIKLFDYFEAKNSMAIRIEMSAKDRTLEGKEVDELMARIVLGLEKELGVEIRK